MNKTSFQIWLENKMTSMGNMDKFGKYDPRWEGDEDNDGRSMGIQDINKDRSGNAKFPKDYRSNVSRKAAPLSQFGADETESIARMINTIKNSVSSQEIMGDGMPEGVQKSDVAMLIKMLKHHSSPRSISDIVEKLPNPVLAIIKYNVPSLSKSIMHQKDNWF